MTAGEYLEARNMAGGGEGEGAVKATHSVDLADGLHME
jgi:hypothetical protein